MLKVVAENKSESDNVLNFPECRMQQCPYASECPFRATFIANPGLDSRMTSGLFASVSDGKVSLNGLTNVPESDIGPLKRTIGAAYRQLCKLYKKTHLKRPPPPINEQWYR